MIIHFWGVRGSLPSPITPQQIQAKIAAVVQRITPKDLESIESREMFIANLPDWLYGTVGGNTPCLQITTKAGKEIILDAGSGIRDLGKSSPLPKDKHFSMFFSHFHWDHVQGIPFFDHVYNPNVTIDVYSPFPAAKRILSNQMTFPYYPVTADSLTKNLNFHTLELGQDINVDGLKVSFCKMKHPGNSYAYSFTESGKKFVYATDVELSKTDYSNNENVKRVFYGADAVVLDSQYTLEEAYRKENWGHSTFSYAIDFAVAMKIKSVYIFHHEPTYDDKKIDSILQSARWYTSYVSHDTVKVFLSVEGQEIEL